MTPEQQFIAAIADSIRAELEAQQGIDLPDRYLEWIDIDQLAQAVHKTIIDYQAPPF